MKNPLKNLSSVVLLTFLGLAGLSGAAVSTAGCGGGGSGTGGGGGAATCPDYSNFDGTTPAVSFKADVLPILQRSCGLAVSCHGDSSMPFKDRPYFGPNKKDMATDADIMAIFAGSVGVDSYVNPGMMIIKAGDPENSFLMYKLDDQLECDKLTCAATKACGGFMPSTSLTILEQTERDAIRRWIAQGAKNN